jgi:hypothetical protein
MLFEAFIVFLSSTAKFFFSFPLAHFYGFSALETILITSLGGITGVLFFYYLSEAIIIWFQRHHFVFRRKSRNRNYLLHGSGSKNIFTKRNRFIVKTVHRYGLVGLIVLTPVLLSIPFGVFITLRYYSDRKNLLVYFALSIVSWAFVLAYGVALF